MSNQDNKISLTTAQSWAQEWRSEESVYNKHNECHAFLIPAEDLAQVLEEMKAQKGPKYVRAYLGVEPTAQTEKLMIVGTRPETQTDGSIVYRDLISDGDDGSDGGSIWDFTQPCPPDCDDRSPLN